MDKVQINICKRHLVDELLGVVLEVLHAFLLGDFSRLRANATTVYRDAIELEV
jgi:hypothetical protein